MHFSNFIKFLKFGYFMFFFKSLRKKKVGSLIHQKISQPTNGCFTSTGWWFQASPGRFRTASTWKCAKVAKKHPRRFNSSPFESKRLRKSLSGNFTIFFNYRGWILSHSKNLIQRCAWKPGISSRSLPGFLWIPQSLQIDPFCSHQLVGGEGDWWSGLKK